MNDKSYLDNHIPLHERSKHHVDCPLHDLGTSRSLYNHLIVFRSVLCLYTPLLITKDHFLRRLTPLCISLSNLNDTVGVSTLGHAPLSKGAWLKERATHNGQGRNQSTPIVCILFLLFSVTEGAMRRPLRDLTTKLSPRRTRGPGVSERACKGPYPVWGQGPQPL